MGAWAWGGGGGGGGAAGGGRRGGRLARAALDDARARGLVVMPFCPFIAAYIERHLDEYGDLVAPEMLTGDRDHDPEASRT
jgi:GCN5-related N-acetyl-transferase